MLIPGNPAIKSYYEEWIKEIKEEYEFWDITYATSYVLFDKKLSSHEYDQAMRSHYEKIFLEVANSEKVTIIGHSVGSYFALRLLEKYPEKVEKVIILFPYIGYSNIKLLNFIKIPYLIDLVFPLVEIVSKWKGILLRNIKNVEEIAINDLNACLRFGVRQCMYFDKYKFNPGKHFFQKNKIDFIYCDNDKWCPKETIEILKPISNHRRVDLHHDFILDKKEREKMIKELHFS